LLEIIFGHHILNPYPANVEKYSELLIVFQYISNKMQRYTVYLYLVTALHVSGGTSTHHQERMHLYLQHLVFVTPLLLFAAIVEELEPVWMCCGWRTPPTEHPNLFQLFHDSGR
jgi:predicted benzoate:H+ symporter BenE